jgi:hypothetical protein
MANKGDESMARLTRPRRGAVGRALAAATILGLVSAVVAPACADVADADKKTLAELALRWAVDGGIADVALMKDPSTLVVVDTHLPPGVRLAVAGRTVRVLAPAAIQAEADRAGDLLYFRFDRFAGDARRASVPIALVWAVGKGSTVHYLSGGGATLDFEQRDGAWVLLPVSNRWMSDRNNGKRDA